MIVEKSKEDVCANCRHYRGVHGEDGKCIGPGRGEPRLPIACDRNCERFVDKDDQQHH